MKITTQMQYRILGRTGIRVSAIGLGTRAIDGVSYGKTEDKWSKVMISLAFGAGASFISTADFFGNGHSEILVGKLTNCRSDIAISTGGGRAIYTDTASPNKDFSAEYLRFAINQSRERLRKDALLVYLLDSPPLSVLEKGNVFRILEGFQSETLIHNFGVSINSPDEGFAALTDSRVSVLAMPFNLFSGNAHWLRLLDTAQKANVGIIIKEPLANGILTGKFSGTETFPSTDIRSKFPKHQFAAMAEAARQFKFLIRPDRTLAQAALQYVLSYPAVSTVVVGCKDKAQVTENFAAIDSPPLSPTELADIESVVHKLSTG